MQGSVTEFLKPRLVDIEQINTTHAKVTLEPSFNNYFNINSHYQIEPALSRTFLLVSNKVKTSAFRRIDLSFASNPWKRCKSFNLVKETVKSVIRYVLIDPQLAADFKKC